MNRTTALQKYNKQGQEQGKHLFEYECGMGGAHLCVIETLDEFLQRIARQKSPLAWHEVLFLEKPCLLFMDCERTGDPSEIDQDQYVQRVHEQVQACVQHYQIIQPPKVIIGSRPGKFSLHLIWNLWCESMHPIRLICDFIRKQNIMDVTIDTQVIPANPGRPKTMRMVYSCKLTQATENILVPQGGPVQFSPQVLCDHLLTFHSEHSHAWTLSKLPSSLFAVRNLPGFIQAGVSTKRLRFEEEGDMETTSEDVAVLDWMEMVFPLFQRTCLVRLTNGAWRCSGFIFCHVSNKWHKSNQTYVHADHRGCITFVCADVDCRVSILQGFTESQIRVSRQPLTTQWNIIQFLRK